MSDTTDETSPCIVCFWNQEAMGATIRTTHFGPFEDYQDALAWCEAKMERDDQYLIVPLIEVHKHANG